MSTLFDHVRETPEYDIECERCLNATDKCTTEQEAAKQAAALGFQVTYGDEVLCSTCYPAVISKAEDQEV
jgi:hypothetical protein